MYWEYNVIINGVFMVTQKYCLSLSCKLPLKYFSFSLQLKELHSQGYSLLSIDASGQTALHYGSCYGHKDIVKYLIACAPASILNMADNDK
jgi:hypothetical protein